MTFGPIAQEYLRKFSSKDGTDKTFGIYDRNGQFYMGDSHVDITDNDLKMNGNTCDGTPVGTIN